MINMSYCRFENTLRALQECAEVMSRSTEYEWIAELGLSESEAAAARKLMELCDELAKNYGE